MIATPCKGCTRRTIGCHSNCEEYAEYREAMERLNAARHNDKNARMWFDYDKYKHGMRGGYSKYYSPESNNR